MNSTYNSTTFSQTVDFSTTSVMGRNNIYPNIANNRESLPYPEMKETYNKSKIILPSNISSSIVIEKKKVINQNRNYKDIIKNYSSQQKHLRTLNPRQKFNMSNTLSLIHI